jgi:hypothetical protein
MVRERTNGLAARRYDPPVECVLIRRDGTRVTAEIEALLADFDGAPAMVALARDLTERRRMVARMAAADRMLSSATLAAGVACGTRSTRAPRSCAPSATTFPPCAGAHRAWGRSS